MQRNKALELKRKLEILCSFIFSNVTKVHPLISVAEAWNRYVGNCCARRSKEGHLFAWAATVTMKAYSDTWKACRTGLWWSLQGQWHGRDYRIPEGAGTKSHQSSVKRTSPRRKGDTRPTSLLSPKLTTLFGTWNVKTVYEALKVAQIAAEMTTFKLSILAINGTRLIESGCMRLATGHTVLFIQAMTIPTLCTERE